MSSCCIILRIIPWKQDLSLNLEMGWRPVSLGDLPASASHSAGVTGVHVAVPCSFNDC